MSYLFRHVFRYLVLVIQTDKVEEVELEDLHGVQGLKALRVTVDMQTSAPEGMLVPEEVEEAVKAMLQVAG